MRYLIVFVVFLLIVGCAEKQIQTVESGHFPTNVTKEKLNEEQTADDEPDLISLSVSSNVISNNGDIPSKYTCDGDNINPHLRIEGVPESARSLVIIVDDPDAPSGTFNHWVVWNIPAEKEKEVFEKSVPGIQGMNDFKEQSYGGPCPPSGQHRYFFKVFALDSYLDIPPNSGKRDVEKAIEGHVVAKGGLVGLYGKK